MIQVVVIEDETPALQKLVTLLQSVDFNIKIVKSLDSVEAAVNFFTNNTEKVDLIFMDIQLGDGLSFDIFNAVEVNIPVIFTTAFDQYTLQAFKVNSIDYLLKPIDEAELILALQKFTTLHHNKQVNHSDKLLALVQQITVPKFKERLLIKRGQQLSYLNTIDLAFCFADGKLCYAVDNNNTKFLLETNLTILEEQLAPNSFFRVNRGLLVNINAIKKVHTWLGGRLKVELQQPTTIETIVSRERVADFKNWLGQ
jgi:DNA-binding LytR/AlgR family response regulator